MQEILVYTTRIPFLLVGLGGQSSQSEIKKGGMGGGVLGKTKQLFQQL